MSEYITIDEWCERHKVSRRQARNLMATGRVRYLPELPAMIASDETPVRRGRPAPRPTWEPLIELIDERPDGPVSLAGHISAEVADLTVEHARAFAETVRRRIKREES